MFKILADECVHRDIIEGLKEVGFNIATIDDTNLRGVSDDSVFNFAVKNKRILLTLDREFGNFFRFNIKDSAGVVIVLIGQMKKEEIIKNTLNFFRSIRQKSLRGKLVIIGKIKVRIRSF